MSDDIPASWRVYLERKGLASYRRLGDAAQISHEAARRVVTGRGVRPGSVAAVARAMGVDVEVVHQLRAESPDRAAVWEPPASSSLLTQDEREALNRLVHLLTLGRQHEDGDGRGNTPPIGVHVAEDAMQVPPRPSSTAAATARSRQPARGSRGRPKG